MTAKEYNQEIWPKVRHARSFLANLDHALEKAGPEAVKQAALAGWDDATRRVLAEGLELYDAGMRSKIERDGRQDGAGPEGDKEA